MTDTDFEGRVALITGGASGIGAASARRIQAGGGRVAIVDLDAAAVQAAADELGDGTIGIAADVTSSAALGAAVAQTESELGGLDILICSAGIAGASLRTVDVGDDEWRRVLAVNADGVFFANRAVLPGMTARGYGRIVNLASVAGKEGNPMAAAYSAAKAAVIGMTKSIGKDVATTGVLVNCITPAPVETPMIVGLSQEHLDYMLSRVPMGRLAKAEEAAELIAFLASDRMTFSTGAAFDLSGGRLTY
ncbi:MAG TPA: SDR family NAD(P)-dependent oxidoreductase [Gaiellales bacterium]|jgi:3-oxoacyl-[acyl-carrier protein] reductase